MLLKGVIIMHHEGELKCDKCNITFENDEEMKKHMKEAHGEEQGDH